MREIDYRAWDIDDNKMWKVVGISEAIWGSSEEEKHVMVCDFDKNPMSEETDVRVSYNYKLMQFTGLRDKNGKKIYEGDIDKDIKGNISVVVYLEKYGTYTFLPYFEYLGIESNGSNYSCYVHDAMPHIYSEIIGNVFENPGLLNY